MKPLYARPNTTTDAKTNGKKTTRLITKSAACFEKEIKLRIESKKELSVVFVKYLTRPSKLSISP